MPVQKQAFTRSSTLNPGAQVLSAGKVPPLKEWPAVPCKDWSDFIEFGANSKLVKEVLQHALGWSFIPFGRDGDTVCSNQFLEKPSQVSPKRANELAGFMSNFSRRLLCQFHSIAPVLEQQPDVQEVLPTSSDSICARSILHSSSISASRWR